METSEGYLLVAYAADNTEKGHGKARYGYKLYMPDIQTLEIVR
jgi:hypothetical protein